MSRAIFALALAVLCSEWKCLAFPTERRQITPSCTDFIVPVTASAPSKLLLPGDIPTDLSDPTVLVDFVTSQATSALGSLLGGLLGAEVSGTYDISARYCEPSNHNASRAQTVHFLVHAITDDKDYWNGLSHPEGYDGEQYSWLGSASQAGFPTFSIDSLGSGNSSHPNPIGTVQQPLQAAIIHSLVTSLRSGSLAIDSNSLTCASPPCAAPPFAAPNTFPFIKFVYVGHSYGSILGNLMAITHPTDFDALVLTGYTGDFVNGVPALASGILLPAATVSPDRFGELPVGYLEQSSPAGRERTFYTVDGVGGFDPAVPPYDFAREGTVAVGELATLLAGLSPAPSYTNPVLVLTGSNDTIVCATPNVGGDCGSGPDSRPARAAAFFPNARDYTYYVPPATGHAVDTHYSFPGTWQVTEGWLGRMGF